MSIEERVAAGAAWLDETRPGWERRVDLDKLDLSSCCRCVLGQIFSDEAAELNENVPAFNGYEYVTVPAFNGYGWASRNLEWVDDDDALGFDVEGSMATAAKEYAALDEAWIALLKTRFDSGALSDEGLA